MSQIADNIYQGALSIAKIVLQSRHADSLEGERHPDDSRLIVLGNGPSLNETIAAHIDTLRHTPTMAVNFAAIAPVFFDIRPRYYVMADPHFFAEPADESDNRTMLRAALQRVDWPMTLLVPALCYRRAKELYGARVKVLRFNAIGIEGPQWLRIFSYRHGLGMPRPRNVLIPAIMLGIALGYKEVVICGADHSWMKTLSVTDDNEVVSVQPHFYADGKNEQTRIRHEYRGYRLHQIVESFAVAFRSYHDIAAYAAHRGVRILNATPDSFIDAFPRTRL